MRPDFAPMRILTDEQYIPIKEKKAFEILHGNYFGREFEGHNYSIWKRWVNYLYPWNDYKTDQSYYEPFFDYKKDYVIEEHKNHYHFNI